MKCAFVDLGRHFGGAENYLISIVESWIKDGNDAVLIVKKGSVFAEKVSEIFRDDIVCPIDYSYNYIKYVRSFLMTSNVDIIHVNGINSGLFIYATGVKIKRVTTVHSDADMDRINRPLVVRKLFVMTENFCLRKSSKIIAVSDSIRNSLLSRRISAQKIIVVNNGIDNIDYPNRKYRVTENEKLNICFVGRLEAVKGCEYLLKALSLCKNMNIMCDVYGEGTEKNRLECMAKRLGISRAVCFKGYSNMIRELLPKYDVIVMPSLFEASPLTIPEAMNARTLVVASDVGGIPFLIKNKENGYLFRSKDYKQLADILVHIYRNPDVYKRIVDNAYGDFVKYYTFDVMKDKTFRILRDINSMETKVVSRY